MSTETVREQRFPDRDRNDEGRAENARPRDRFGRPLPRGSVDEMPDRAEPDDIVGSVEEALRAAASLFEQQRFFEAHEFLEWIWKSDAVDEGDRDFWKGVTQVAVGCCHTQRGNARGSVTLLERAAGALARYPGQHRGVRADALRRDALALVEQVRRDGPSPAAAFPSLPLSLE